MPHTYRSRHRRLSAQLGFETFALSEGQTPGLLATTVKLGLDAEEVDQGVSIWDLTSKQSFIFFPLSGQGLAG